MPYADAAKQAAAVRAWQSANKPAMKAHKKLYRDRMPEGALDRPFVGVDGEGGTQNGRHGYYLLRVGESCLYNDGVPLTTAECLEFLWECGAASRGILVGYFFNYDVTMMLMDASDAQLISLFKRDTRKYVDPETKREQFRKVQIKGYYVDYIPSKFFSVGKWVTTSKLDKDGTPRRKMQTVIVSDVSGFFQCSFSKTLKAWNIGSPELVEKIAADKARRSEFTGLYSTSEIEYNRAEVYLLELLMARVRDVCTAIDLKPRQWQGAGCLASAMLKKNNAPNRDVYMPPEVLEAAQYAYFGGRFECSRIGAIPGPIYECDISSAYPAAMTHLPCFLHGEWRQYESVKRLPDHPMFLARIRWRLTSPRAQYGPFQWRSTSGRITAPRSGYGWVYGWEILEAMKHDGVCLEFLELWEWRQNCSCKPYDFVGQKFIERVGMGASDAGMVLKLALNSLYGKKAQSVGTARYANPVEAGMITAWTRAKLYECTRLHDDVVMMATDAVYLRSPPKFETSKVKVLGAWDCTELGELFVVQPGLYYGSDRKVKTRGVPQQLVRDNMTLFRDAWRRDGFSGSVSLTIPNSFCGAREAMHRGKRELMGQWSSETRTISFWPVKRTPNEIVNGIGYTSMPAGCEEMSKKYKKIIGGVQSVVADGMCTHTEYPEHPDGSSIEFDQMFPEFSSTS